jgi:hypothetical protein
VLGTTLTALETATQVCQDEHIPPVSSNPRLAAAAEKCSVMTPTRIEYTIPQWPHESQTVKLVTRGSVILGSPRTTGAVLQHAHLQRIEIEIHAQINAIGIPRIAGCGAVSYSLTSTSEPFTPSLQITFHASCRKMF